MQVYTYKREKLWLFDYVIIYEARILLGLGVSDMCRVRHRHDTNTCNYTELCDFFQIIRCVDVSVSVSVLYR